MIATQNQEEELAELHQAQLISSEYSCLSSEDEFYRTHILERSPQTSVSCLELGPPKTNRLAQKGIYI